MLSTVARPGPPGPSAEDGLFVDGLTLQPLEREMHIVSPSIRGWVCVRPTHAGQPCTKLLPGTPPPA